ncbi:MAG: hypothetical protein JXJ04_09995 [Spirochaetales bacterium]|nr:hypothetical protein [Spirochaetales bacterium]
MMKRQSIFFLIISIIVTFLYFGCALPTEEEPDICENVMIFSGNSDLITDMDTPVLLESETPTRGYITNFEYNITQISRIRPTTVNNHTVQANDILISGTTSYVAYNTAGDIFDGAIQVIKKTGKKITLEYEIQFRDMDIICLSKQGDDLVFGGMANPDVFDGKRSFIGKINLRGPKSSRIVESFVFLSSYAATGVTKLDDQYYVSLGAADGGIKILDNNMGPVQGTLETPDILADDIRDIEAYASGIVVLVGTTDSEATNGRILIIKEDAVTKEIEITDFDSPEAKATIEVNDNYAYLGLSAKGFQVCDLTSEKILFTFDNPDDSPLHVTNSISYHENLIFSANGEYGFRVLDYTPSQTSADIVGYFSFSGLTDENEQNYSANHIAYKSKCLIVASGAGGVLYYELSDK